jgi:hypothetical protein
MRILTILSLATLFLTGLLLQNNQNLEDRKCLGKPRKSFAGDAPAWLILKTVPERYFPPTIVVPKRLPLSSRNRAPPESGLNPSQGFPEKRCKTENSPAALSLNTVPQPGRSYEYIHLGLPPVMVVPYKSPDASRTRPEPGHAPSAPPVKWWSTVTLPLGLILNTVPWFDVPPRRVVP